MIDLTKNDGFFTHRDADYNDNDKEAIERHQKKIDAECELFEGVPHHIVIRHRYMGLARYALIGVMPGVGVKDKDISREAAMILISSLNLRRAHTAIDPDNSENSLSVFDDPENPARGMLAEVEWRLKDSEQAEDLNPIEKKVGEAERARKKYYASKEKNRAKRNEYARQLYKEKAKDPAYVKARRVYAREYRRRRIAEDPDYIAVERERSRKAKEAKRRRKLADDEYRDKVNEQRRSYRLRRLDADPNYREKENEKQRMYRIRKKKELLTKNS